MYVFLIDSYIDDPSKGGPANVIHEFAKFLTKKGHSVNVVTSDICGEKRLGFKKKIHDGVKVNYFKTTSLYLAKKNKQLSFGMILWLLSKRENIELIIINQVRGFTPIMLSLARPFLKVPILLFPFGMSPKKKGLLRSVFDLLFTAPLIKSCSKIFCQSNSEIREVKKTFNLEDTNSCLKILPLPVNLDIAPLEIKSSKSQDNYLLFLGRLDKNKGIDRIIKLFSNLKQHGYNGKLKLCGNDYGDLINIKKQINQSPIRDQISILDPVYDQKRFNLYQDADAYVILSKTKEETSLASLEALSMGCPVILNENLEVPLYDKREELFYVNNDILEMLDYDKKIPENEIINIKEFLEKFKDFNKRQEIFTNARSVFSIDHLGVKFYQEIRSVKGV